jgi:hypothetical protein
MYLGNFTSFAVRSTEGSLTRLQKFILVKGEKAMEEKELKQDCLKLMQGAEAGMFITYLKTQVT